jgi:hypothetical protein
MKLFLALFCALVLMLPAASAQVAGPGPANPNCGIPFDTVNPVGGAVLGQIRACLHLPLNNQVASSNSVFGISVEVTTPVYFVALATIATAFTFTATSGCSITGASVTGSNMGTTGVLVGFMSSAYQAITMTSSQCAGYVRVLVTTTTPASTYYNELLAFTITANDAVRNQVTVGCGSTSTVNAALPYISPCAVPGSTASVNVVNSGGQTVTVTGTLDNLNRFCAASPVGTTCSTPTINAAVSGTLGLTGTVNVVNSGGETIAVTGTLDNLNRFCAASPIGTTCSTPTINAAVSGTLGLTGTVNVVNSGSQAIAISGNLDTLQRLCAASPIGATCTQPTIGISQSGAWQIDNQNRICANSSFGTACTMPILDNGFNGTVSLSGNVSLMRIIATLCGPPINATSCNPVQTSSATDLPQALIDWSPLIIGLLLIIIGEIRSDFVVRAFGGVFLIAAGFLCPLQIFLMQLVLWCVGAYMLLLMIFAAWNNNLRDERKFRRN